MAEEKQLLARARDYMQALSEGKHPLTGRDVEDDCVLDEPRMRRCFAFVAAYLQHELARAADGEELFLPTPEQQRRLCRDEDVPASEFYERINAAAVAVGKKSLSPREINHFLMRAGLVEGHVESLFVERRVLRATECAEDVGIYDKPRLSPRTGALTHTLMLTPDAQGWLLHMLPDIAKTVSDEEVEA